MQESTTFVEPKQLNLSSFQDRPALVKYEKKRRFSDRSVGTVCSNVSHVTGLSLLTEKKVENPTGKHTPLVVHVIKEDKDDSAGDEGYMREELKDFDPKNYLKEIQYRKTETQTSELRQKL